MRSSAAETSLETSTPDLHRERPASPAARAFWRPLFQMRYLLDTNVIALPETTPTFGSALPKMKTTTPAARGVACRATFGRLTVSLLDRRDIILMKIHGQRPRDVQDLHTINPTPGELEFVRAQLPRIATKEREMADSMRAFLHEWEART